MRRTFWCDALVAITVLIVLMGAGRPRKWGAVSSVASPEYQSETWLFCIDDSGSSHSEWPATRDYTIVDSVATGAGAAKREVGPSFLYETVRSAGNDTAFCATYYSDGLYSNMVNDASWPPTQFSCVWFDLSRLPEDITILSAKLCMRTRQAVTFTGTSGSYAVLDTIKRDEGWLNALSATGGSGGCTVTGQIRRGSASWLYMRALGGGTGYEWNPPLNNRTESWDWGVRSAKWTTNYTVGGEVAWDVTNAVQHYATYRHANAGFWLRGTQNAAPGEYACGYLTPRARMPFLKVTFVRKPYRFRWDGYPIAFALTTDDQHVDNLTWKATADSFGYKYTLYCRGDAAPFTGSSSTRLTVANLQDYYADGYEIGHHSLSHSDTWGLAEIVSDQDSMNTQVERTWLASALGIPTTAIRTFAYPNGGFNILAQKTLRNYGYLLARCAGDTATDNTEPPWSTADGGQFLRVDRTRNLFAVQRSIAEATLLGGTGAADTATYWSMRDKLYDYIADSEENGQYPLILLIHDFKTTTTYANNGMDADEWRWLCRMIQRHGKIGVFTMEQIARMYRARNMAVDAPTWATAGVADGQVAADSLWWGGGW